MGRRQKPLTYWQTSRFVHERRLRHGSVGCVDVAFRELGVVNFTELRRVRVVAVPTQWAGATGDARQWQDTDYGHCQRQNNFM